MEEIESLSEKAKEILIKVKGLILEEPRRMIMEYWHLNTVSELSDRGLMEPPCGTVGCIAGWVTECTGERLPNEYVDSAAKRILGLSRGQADRLFFQWNWPDEFKQALPSKDVYDPEGDLLKPRPQTPEYAMVVAARIDRFIQTGGSE